MSIKDRDSFLRAASRGVNFIPLVHSWPADLETPLTTWLKVSQKDSFGVLLESVEGGETLGRWSVVASDPLWIGTAKGDKFTRKWRDGKLDTFNGNPFQILRQLLEPYNSEPISNLPCLGQLYGMWGYELIKWIEPKVPVCSSGEIDIPDGIWMFMDRVIIFDQVKRVINAICYGDLTNGKSPEKVYSECFKRVKELEEMMEQSLPSMQRLSWHSSVDNSHLGEKNWTKSEFENAVKSAKEFIAKGDIFQLVLSQKFHTKVSHKPFDIYRSLRMVNPSPFMSFFNFGNWQ